MGQMIRKAFAMTVRPDAHDEYRRRHDAIWPALVAVLRDHGVRNYTIYLDRGRSQLFACAEIESLERWEAIALTPVCRRWWAFMRDIMETNADDSPRADDLVEVFHLSGADD